MYVRWGFGDEILILPEILLEIFFDLRIEPFCAEDCTQLCLVAVYFVPLLLALLNDQLAVYFPTLLILGGLHLIDLLIELLHEALIRKRRTQTEDIGLIPFLLPRRIEEHIAVAVHEFEEGGLLPGGQGVGRGGGDGRDRVRGQEGR